MNKQKSINSYWKEQEPEITKKYSVWISYFQKHQNLFFFYVTVDLFFT